MADDEPRAGELTTANYGWTKPNVGNSDDAWGGMLNADLDGIDTTVKSVSTVANAAQTSSQVDTKIAAAAYVLPTASTSILGGVKVDGSTIAINSGIISAAGASITVSDAAPPSPSAGALWFDSAGGQLYVFYVDPNTSQWVPTTNQMGGGYATQVYVNSLPVIGDNRIINGDMRIDQRNNGASGTAAGYTVDRWYYLASQASKGTWQRPGGSGGIISSGFGFGYYLAFTSSSAYTSAATDYFCWLQSIEADAISDFSWGSAGAQPVTLSFLVFSSLTGTFGGSVSNYASTRAYPFTYSIPVANTWTKIVVTIPGDTAGTWVLSGNAGAITLHFDLGSGSTYRAPAGAWTNGNYLGANGTVNVVSTSGATFNVTGVKLEVGSVATPYNRQSLAKSMADCQRYYSNTALLYLSVYSTGSNSFVQSITLPVTMRAAPTITFAGASYTNASGIFLAAGSITSPGVGAVATATGTAAVSATIVASAEL